MRRYLSFRLSFFFCFFNSMGWKTRFVKINCFQVFWELKSKSCYRGIQLEKQDQRNHYRITYQLSNRKKRSSPLHHHPNKKEENLTCSSLPRHQFPEVRFSQLLKITFGTIDQHQHKIQIFDGGILPFFFSVGGR